MKLNGINNKKISTDSYRESPRNNLQNMVASSKNNQNNDNHDINYNNNGLNTSNTYEHNNVSPATIEKLKQIVNNSDKLIIEIINSLTSQRNLKIEINALGMVSDSKRKAYDGNTFFGYVENENENKEVDFVVKQRDNNPENNNIIGRHFRIRFDINSMNYYITFTKTIIKII